MNDEIRPPRCTIRALLYMDSAHGAPSFRLGSQLKDAPEFRKYFKKIGSSPLLSQGAHPREDERGRAPHRVVPRDALWDGWTEQQVRRLHPAMLSTAHECCWDMRPPAKGSMAQRWVDRTAGAQTARSYAINCPRMLLGHASSSQLAMHG